MAVLESRKPLQKFETELPTTALLTRRRAGVGLVDDHKLRAVANQFVTVSRLLDEVGRDDRHIELRENGLVVSDSEAALKATYGRTQYQFGIDVELVAELSLPLLREMRWTEDREAVNLAAIEEFTSDQAGLDGLADADIVGDQEPHGIEPQRHEERHELIRPRLYGNLRKRPKGPRAESRRDAGRIAKQSAGDVIACILRIGRRETRRFNSLDRWQDANQLLIKTAKRLDHHEIRKRARLDHPFATANLDERAGLKGDRVGHCSSLLCACEDVAMLIEYGVPIGGVMEAKDKEARALEPLGDLAILNLLLGSVVVRTVDVYDNALLLVHEIRLGPPRREEALGMRRKPQMAALEQVDESTLEIGIASGSESCGVLLASERTLELPNLPQRQCP